MSNKIPSSKSKFYVLSSGHLFAIRCLIFWNYYLLFNLRIILYNFQNTIFNFQWMFQFLNFQFLLLEIESLKIHCLPAGRQVNCDLKIENLLDC